MFSQKWDERFMEVARLIATWSKDTSTKTGAIVVGPDKEIRATGYNGFVRGVDDEVAARYERPTKYDFFEHAERNAVYNACLTGTSLKGCTMYATHDPCTDCARAIIQSGIKKVVTCKFPANAVQMWHDKASFSEEMFKEAGVEVVYLENKEP